MGRIIPLHRLPVFSIVNPPDLSFNFADGAAFLINKPRHWSSFDVVKFLRKCVDLQQVGHAGTLDPMATGLLIVCCGKGTKTISAIQNQAKAYNGEVTLGASTASYDVETPVKRTASYTHITKNKVKKVLSQHFAGTIQQKPPMYSAVKKDGKPLYQLARQGKKVKRPARDITIYAARIISCNLPKLNLYVKCSKGTYIRAIAHNLGKKLKSQGYLSGLRRIGIGRFDVADALSIDDLRLLFPINK